MPNVSDAPKGLVGGARGEHERGINVPLFYPEVKVVELSIKQSVGVRVLPSFDYAMDWNDPRFPLSCLPYRETNPAAVDGEGKALFSSWYVPLVAYRFIGRRRNGWLSPLTRERRRTRGIDPLYDIYLTAKNHTNPEWKKLTEKPAPGVGKSRDAVLPKPRDLVAVNGLVQVKQTMENAVVLMNEAGFRITKADLNAPRPASEVSPRDPNWPYFLLGDVTSLQYGLWATSEKVSVASEAAGGAGFETSVLKFSQSRERLVNVRPHPIDPNTPEGQAILRGRFNIADTEKVSKVATAEEILDMVVRDGFLPYPLIQEACGDTWTIPAEPANRTSFPATAPADDADDEIPYSENRGVFNSAPATGVPVRSFWVYLNGQPVSKTESEVRLLAIQYGPQLQVILSGETVWQTAAYYGLAGAATAPAAAPVPVAATPVPVAPPAPVAAPAPVLPAPPAAQVSPPVSQRQFWVSVNGQVQPKSESEVRTLAEQLGPQLQVMLVGETAWQTALHYGLAVVPAPAPVAPPAPPAPVAPPAPPAPVAPPAPTAPAVPYTQGFTPPTVGGFPPPPNSAAGFPPPPVTQPSAPPPSAPVAPPLPPSAPVAPPLPPSAPVAPPLPPSAPVAPPPPVAGLTPAEQAELQALQTRFGQSPGTFPQQDYARLNELFARSASAAQARTT